MTLVTRPCDFPSCNRESRGPGNEATVHVHVHVAHDVCKVAYTNHVVELLHLVSCEKDLILCPDAAPSGLVSELQREMGMWGTTGMGAGLLVFLSYWIGGGSGESGRAKRKGDD